VSIGDADTRSKHSRAYLNDLLVLHTSQEDVLLVFIRVEFDTMRNLAVGEGLYTLT